MYNNNDNLDTEKIIALYKTKMIERDNENGLLKQQNEDLKNQMHNVKMQYSSINAKSQMQLNNNGNDKLKFDLDHWK